MSESQQREAERLEADLRMAERANVERYRHEQHLQRLEARREVSPPGSRSVSPPSRPVTPPPEVETERPNANAVILAHSVRPISEKTSWKARRFLITLNEVEAWDRLKAYLISRPYQYIVAAYEEAPTTLHEHMHIFIIYKKATELAKSKMEGAHVDIVRGTNEQARDYTKKEDHIIFEDGECPEDRKTTTEKKGLSIKDVEDTPWEELKLQRASAFRYFRDIKSEQINERARERRCFKPIEFYWFHGPTGTGKSRAAFEEGAYPVIYNNGFFSDWGENRILVIEETRGEIPYAKLLQLADGYHGYYAFNIKGGQRILDIDKLIVTSPLRPEECYPRQCQKRDSIQQLMRRVTKLVFFNEHGEQLEEDPTDLHIPPAADFSAQQSMWSHQDD